MVEKKWRVQLNPKKLLRWIFHLVEVWVLSYVSYFNYKAYNSLVRRLSFGSFRYTWILWAFRVPRYRSVPRDRRLNAQIWAKSWNLFIKKISWFYFVRVFYFPIDHVLPGVFKLIIVNLPNLYHLFGLKLWVFHVRKNSICNCFLSGNNFRDFVERATRLGILG